MSSWSASAYPPPRRSRSRSPRGAFAPRPPYPDSYAPDYHGAWDSFDRGPWPDFERDRAPYEHARRGRSRSPPPDESMSQIRIDFSLSHILAGRKRRRSMSPYDRERYDPRPRYGDDYGTLFKSIFIPNSNSLPLQMLTLVCTATDRLLVHNSLGRTPLSYPHHLGERLLTLVLWTTLLH